jgi:hypothetical protein
MREAVFLSIIFALGFTGCVIFLMWYGALLIGRQWT